MKKKDQESLRKIVIIGLVLVVGYLGYQSMTSGSSPFSEASEFAMEDPMGETPTEDKRAERQADRAQRQAEKEQKAEKEEEAEEPKQDPHPPFVPAGTPGMNFVPVDQSHLDVNPFNVKIYYDTNISWYETHIDETGKEFKEPLIVTNPEGVPELNTATIQQMLSNLNSQAVGGVALADEVWFTRYDITGFKDCDQGLPPNSDDYCGCLVMCTQIKEGKPLESSYLTGLYSFYEPSKDPNNWGNKETCQDYQKKGMPKSLNTFCTANAFYEKDKEEK